MRKKVTEGIARRSARWAVLAAVVPVVLIGGAGCADYYGGYPVYNRGYYASGYGGAYYPYGAYYGPYAYGPGYGYGYGPGLSVSIGGGRSYYYDRYYHGYYWRRDRRGNLVRARRASQGDVVRDRNGRRVVRPNDDEH